MPFSTSPQRQFLPIVALLAALGLGLTASCAFSEAIAPIQKLAKSGSPLEQVQLKIGHNVYHLEKAATPEQEEKGLMYRTRLAENHGMLFPFNPPRPVLFWMKNTKIPLDMVFFAQGKVLYIEHEAPPCISDPCPTYGPDEPVDMVVELPAGTARKHHIAIGADALPVNSVPITRLTNQHE